MDIREILKKVDHTLLGVTAGWSDIEQILIDAEKFGTASACIPPAFVKRAKEYVGDRVKICTVIGFPNGYNTTAAKVFEEQGQSLPYLVGTMIEVPRAALTANEIATVADFFSFGTNDLTQMTFGFSRDDAPKFLKFYKEHGIIKTDPFEVLDQVGVGQLVEMGVRKGRSVKPELKIGICGEHGGEPSSVKFCAHLGMNYVSCSPYRVPIARVAAAQAAIE